MYDEAHMTIKCPCLFLFNDIVCSYVVVSSFKSNISKFRPTNVFLFRLDPAGLWGIFQLLGSQAPTNVWVKALKAGIGRCYIPGDLT